MQSNKRSLIYELIGKRLTKLYYDIEHDSLVMCFDGNYELTVKTYWRITSHITIISTSLDMFINNNHERDDIECSQSLIINTISVAANLLLGHNVYKAHISRVKDLILKFDNDISILVFNNCNLRDFEYFVLTHDCASIKSVFDQHDGKIKIIRHKA